MIVCGTTEAEGVLACANHSRYDLTKISLLDAAINRIRAVRRGAPFEVLFVIDVGTGEELFISEKIGVSKTVTTF